MVLQVMKKDRSHKCSSKWVIVFFTICFILLKRMVWSLFFPYNLVAYAIYFMLIETGTHPR